MNEYGEAKGQIQRVTHHGHNLKTLRNTIPLVNYIYKVLRRKISRKNCWISKIRFSKIYLIWYAKDVFDLFEWFSYSTMRHKSHFPSISIIFGFLRLQYRFSRGRTIGIKLYFYEKLVLDWYSLLSRFLSNFNFFFVSGDSFNKFQ